MRQKISKFRGKIIISQDNLYLGMFVILICLIFLYFLYENSFKDFEMFVSFVFISLFGMYLLKKVELVIDSNKKILSYSGTDFPMDKINLFKIVQLDNLKFRMYPTLFSSKSQISKLYQIVLVTKDSNLFEIFEQSNNLEDLNKILEILETEGFKVINSEFKEEKKIKKIISEPDYEYE